MYVLQKVACVFNMWLAVSLVTHDYVSLPALVWPAVSAENLNEIRNAIFILLSFSLVQQYAMFGFGYLINWILFSI